MKVIIYILYHDKAYEEKVMSIYAKYDWAIPFLIDNTIYMESWFYIHHLPILINSKQLEVDAYDYIGALSFSAYSKMLLPYFNEKFSSIISTYTVISFITSKINLVDQTNICHKGLINIIENLINKKLENNILFTVCNAWMIKSKYIGGYLDFIRSIYLGMQKEDKLYVSIEGYYGSHELKNEILLNKKDVLKPTELDKFKGNNYSLHCFICERLPSIYFNMMQYNIFNYTEFIETKLGDDELFIEKEKQERANIGTIYKYIDCSNEKIYKNDNDYIIYCIEKNNVEDYPDIICNGITYKLAIWK